MKGLAEPSLVLSLPKQPTEFDDGLLIASEVAQLKLNADWVVLSACNTIAGDKPGAEALSGLARSFFYAGARALLVSHWAVDSQATVKLVTGAFAALAGEPDAPHAEVMRQSMLALVKAGGHEAHPAFWAPFVVVGADGRSVKRLASAGTPAPTATAPATTLLVTANEGGSIVKTPLPVRAPSAKQRRAAALKQAKKPKPDFKPNTTSAWEEVFSR